MKAQHNPNSKPLKLTTEILRALQEALSDNIKPEYKEHSPDAPKKKHRNKTKNHKK